MLTSEIKVAFFDASRLASSRLQFDAEWEQLVHIRASPNEIPLVNLFMAVVSLRNDCGDTSRRNI